MKRNLVMGMATGYNWYTLEPFVRSFAKNCPNDDLVLFVNGISDFTYSKLESVNIAQKSRGGGILKFETFPEKSHQGLPHNERWKICLDYIENHEDEYEQIFTADTRDVIFQDNVFKKFFGAVFLFRIRG